MLHVSVLLVVSSGYCLAVNLCQTIKGNEPDIVIEGHTFLTVKESGLKQCMRLCSQFRVCESINFFIQDAICQLNYATAARRPGDVIQSVGGSYVGKTDIPQEIAGACWEHVCGENYRCIPVRRIRYTCILHQIKICKNPPTVPNTVFEIFSNSSPPIARYSCIKRSGNSPFQDDPFSTCIGFDEWTTPSVSCSNYDCYMANGSEYSYQGKRSYTASGKHCLDWSVTDFASSARYQKNYCTPQTNYQPWCFYDISKWEFCHVQEC